MSDEVCEERGENIIEEYWMVHAWIVRPWLTLMMSSPTTTHVDKKVLRLILMLNVGLRVRTCRTRNHFDLIGSRCSQIGSSVAGLLEGYLMGRVVWFTGLSGRKTTIAMAAAERFGCEVLDGDTIRDFFES